MTIHTFGDNQAIYGWNNTIEKHHINDLCFIFGKDKLDLLDISKYNIQNYDTIIFCFGELDCRIYINTVIDSNNTYKKIIDNIVKNYFEAIKINIINSNIIFKNICVYNIIPPSLTENITNEEYIYIGSDEERKSYVLYFNLKLKEECLKNNFIFFDIYNLHIDDNGFLKKNVNDGNGFIKNTEYINEYIKKYII